MLTTIPADGIVSSTALERRPAAHNTLRPLQNGTRLRRSSHEGREGVTRALNALTPASPLVRMRDLDPVAARRLENALARRSDTYCPRTEAVKVTGLGKGLGRHQVTRPELLCFAHAEIAVQLAAHVVHWLRTYFQVRRASSVPAALAASVAVRAIWSIGRVALQIAELLTDLPTTDHRAAPLQHMLTELTGIAQPWLRLLPSEIGQYAFTSVEVVGDRVVPHGKHPRTIMASGSALVADLRYGHVIEAWLCPSSTMTATGAMIAEWLRSADVTDRVLGGVLRRSGVALAAPERVKREATLAYDADIWAAAALALFPCEDTLALARAQSPGCRTREALAWSAGQIEAALRSPPVPLRPLTTARADVTLTFDACTVNRAASLLGHQLTPRERCTPHKV